MVNELAEAEYRMIDRGDYDSYVALKRKAAGMGKDSHFDMVRYMLAISDYAARCAQQQEILFIGGMAF